MSDDYIDKDLFNKFVKNRLDNSDVDLANEDPTERFKIINTLFKIMIGIYGSGFANQYDNKPAKDIWFNALLVFTRDQIADGIELMLQDKEFNSVPNLKKFIFYCDEAKNGRNYMKEKIQTKERQKLPKLKDLLD
jgi:hypothetical protein